METTIVFAEQELVRKLEKVFQIFADAQEGWAIAYIPDPSAGDMQEDANISD